MANLAASRLAREYQSMTCNFFKAHGHKIVRSYPNTHEGYVHTVGHGIGLDIHEDPRFLHLEINSALKPGHVVTIEPGLYYVEQGLDVRIEDAVAFNEAGTVISLTEYPYDLVIPMPWTRSALGWTCNAGETAIWPAAT